MKFQKIYLSKKKNKNLRILMQKIAFPLSFIFICFSLFLIMGVVAQDDGFMAGNENSSTKFYNYENRTDTEFNIVDEELDTETPFLEQYFIKPNCAQSNGRRFTAPQTGLYRFKITRGAYGLWPSGDGYWRTAVYMYKNREVQWCGPGELGPCNPDCSVGRIELSQTFSQAEKAGIGDSVQIRLNKGEYVVMIAPDGITGYCGNGCQGSVHLDVTITPTIEVRAYMVKAAFLPTGAYHTFIVTTNAAGTQRYFRGGPDRKVAWKYLITKQGPYVPNTVDWTKNAKYRIVAVGNDATGKNPCLSTNCARLNGIYKYSIWGPNSNSVTRTLLHSCGIDEEKPKGISTPGWDRYL